MLNCVSEKQDELTLSQLVARIQHYHDWLHKLHEEISEEPVEITPDDMQQDHMQQLMIEIVDECITEHLAVFQSILCTGGI